jgi:outer membrane lipoprotein SlyB
MMRPATSLLRLALAATTLLLAACVTIPAGPSRSALPGSKKSWDQYQAADASCRGYATSQAGSPNDAAAAAGVGSAVAGTVIGAAIGGLIGGGEGAAIGAGMGLFTGSAVGVSNAQAAGYGTQQIYDNAYYQCMYGLGNRVPAPAGYVSRSATPAVAARSGPPPNAAIPPPDAPPPNRSPSSAPPPNAAIPPPDTPPPYRLPR